MENLIETLAKSGNKVLEAAANDIQKWSKLKHNKEDLEFFLQFNLAHLKFRPKNAVVMKDIVCTSNIKFIKVFSALKDVTKKKALKNAKNSGIRTNDPATILTFNILDNKYNTIFLDVWEIESFITISDENIEILDKVVNEMLKKPARR